MKQWLPSVPTGEAHGGFQGWFRVHELNYLGQREQRPSGAKGHGGSSVSKRCSVVIRQRMWGASNSGVMAESLSITQGGEGQGGRGDF